jgi:hypothetical protein
LNSAAVLSPSFASAPTNEAEQKRQQYIAALRAHDWTYEFSDEHAVWQRGFNERSRLTRFQREIDPLFAIWNTHAPEDYRTRAAH